MGCFSSYLQCTSKKRAWTHFNSKLKKGSQAYEKSYKRQIYPQFYLYSLFQVSCQPFCLNRKYFIYCQAYYMFQPASTGLYWFLKLTFHHPVKKSRIFKSAKLRKGNMLGDICMSHYPITMCKENKNKLRIAILSQPCYH